MQVNTTKCVNEEAGDGLISLLFVSFSWLSASPTAAFPGEDLPTHTHAHTNLQSVKKNHQRRTVSVCHQKPIFFSVQPEFWAFLQSSSQWMILLLLVCSSETVLVRKKECSNLWLSVRVLILQTVFIFYSVSYDGTNVTIKSRFYLLCGHQWFY